MANSTVTITTTATDEDVLTNSAIKAIIKERLGILTDEEYSSYKSNNGFTLTFRIKFTTTTNKVSINNKIFSETEGHYYISEVFDSGIKSIRIKNVDTIRISILIQ